MALDYKIPVQPRNEYASVENVLSNSARDTLQKIYKRQTDLAELIKQHSKVLRQRDAAASAASEYLRSNLREIDNNENRELLVRGCESTLDRLERDIDNHVKSLENIDQILNQATRGTF
jgi:hypothetical protein